MPIFVLIAGFRYSGQIRDHLNNIHVLDNQNNAKLIYDFYLYLRSINTSESYQNRNIKALIDMAKFFGKNLEFIQILYSSFHFIY